jgi:hypothetical protein
MSTLWISTEKYPSLIEGIYVGSFIAAAAVFSTIMNSESVCVETRAHEETLAHVQLYCQKLPVDLPHGHDDHSPSRLVALSTSTATSTATSSSS